MERTEEMTRASVPEKTLPGSYLDWPAIFGGAVVAIAIGSVLSAFGAALGLSTISARPGAGSFDVLVIVSALWILLSLVVSYMAGGYIAGRMRRRVDSATADEVTARDGIGGLVVWGLGVVATVMLLHAAVMGTVSAAGSVGSAVGSAAGSIASAAGQVAGGAAQGAVNSAASSAENPMGFVTNTMLRPKQVATGGPATPSFNTDSVGILSNVVRTGEISDSDRGYLISAVAAQSGVPTAEATTRVDAAITAAKKARDDAAKLVSDAKAAAIKAVEEARIGAILTGFLLAAAALVAAGAAHGGAVKGGRDRDAGRLYGGFSYRERRLRA
jgi:hypothetical protein